MRKQNVKSDTPAHHNIILVSLLAKGIIITYVNYDIISHFVSESNEVHFPNSVYGHCIVYYIASYRSPILTLQAFLREIMKEKLLLSMPQRLLYLLSWHAEFWYYTCIYSSKFVLLVDKAVQYCFLSDCHFLISLIISIVSFFVNERGFN